MQLLPQDNYGPKVRDNSCVVEHASRPDHTKTQGWGLNTATGHWVRPCGLPSLYAAVLVCDLCEDYFVPKFAVKLETRDLGAMCDECDPPISWCKSYL